MKNIEIVIKGGLASGKSNALAVLIPALNSAGFKVISCEDGIKQEVTPKKSDQYCVSIKTELT